MTTLQFQPATYEAFRVLAQEATVVPVAVTLPADLHTPVSVFLKVAGQSGDVCLFENQHLERHLPPYTLIGCHPRWVITGRDGKVELRTPHATLERTETFLQAVRRRLRADIPARLEEIPAIASAAFGYLAHEAAHQLQRLPPRTPLSVEGILTAFGTVIVFDHVRQRLHIVANVSTDGRTEQLEADYAAAQQRIRSVAQQLNGPFPELPALPPTASRSIVTPMTPEQFRRAVEHTEQRLASGELHVVTLAQRLERPTNAHPFSIYRLLRATPSPSGTFYFSSGNTTVLGRIAHNILQGQGEIIRAYLTTHERPAGSTEAELSLALAELASDDSAMAQHIGFVDALRNDLGQVARYSSVELEILAQAKALSQQVRLVSVIQARLAPERDVLDVLATRLPSAWWTGLPKRPALRLTTTLEPVRRHHFGSQFCLLVPQVEWLAGETCHVLEVTNQVARFYAFATLTGDTNINETLVKGAKTAQYLVALIEQSEALAAPN
ncbi:MAG: chorismate-binding protein [Acidobacteriota bacterium]